MRETGSVLLYNFSGSREQEIVSLCQRCGLQVIWVTPPQFHETIGALLMKKKTDTAAGMPVRAAFAEEMMVIASDRTTLDALLAGFRENQIKAVALKAMVTPVNISWTSAVLHEHLKEEHERMNRSRRPAQEDKTDEP